MRQRQHPVGEVLALLGRTVRHQPPIPRQRAQERLMLERGSWQRLPRPLPVHREGLGLVLLALWYLVPRHLRDLSISHVADDQIR
jgi:hypothetical protein